MHQQRQAYICGEGKLERFYSEDDYKSRVCKSGVFAIARVVNLLIIMLRLLPELNVTPRVSHHRRQMQPIGNSVMIKDSEATSLERLRGDTSLAKQKSIILMVISGSQHRGLSRLLRLSKIFPTGPVQMEENWHFPSMMLEQSSRFQNHIARAMRGTSSLLCISSQNLWVQGAYTPSTARGFPMQNHPRLV